MGNGVITAGAAGAVKAGPATLGTRLSLLAFPLLALVLLVAIPLTLSEFRLSLVAKYLCFAFPAVGIVLISALLVTLFFGGWHGPFGILPSLSFLWFALKTAFFIMLFVLLRASIPRPRYDQVMEAYLAGLEAYAATGVSTMSAAAFRSKPALNAPPAPVSTATLWDLSASKATKASNRVSAVAGSTALRTPGRCRITWWSCPTSSRR